MDRPPEHLDLFPTPVSKYNLSFLDLDKIFKIIKQIRVEPHGLIKLVRGVRELEAAIGDGKKVVTEKEQQIKLKLRK